MNVATAERKELGAAACIPRRNQEERQVIEQAKAVLMNRFSFSEPQAHRHLQRTSMDTAIPMVDIARQILDALG